MQNEMKDVLITVINKYSQNHVDINSKFGREGGFDSFTIMNIITEIEEKLEINCEDILLEIYTSKTIYELYTLLQKLENHDK
jgi:acyl carrier protein